jgi:hypothetical protein
MRVRYLIYVQNKTKKKKRRKKREKSSQNNPSRRIYHNILPLPNSLDHQVLAYQGKKDGRQERNLGKKKKRRQ